MALTRRKIFNWIKFLIIIYSGIGIALYYLQDKILFHPDKLSADYSVRLKTSFKEFSIPVNKKDTVNVINFLPVNNVVNGTVVYFQDCKGSIETIEKNTAIFTKHGFSVWMFEYPGFGKSRGELTEAKLYEYAFQLKRLAESNHSNNNMIIYGEGFGAAIAANLSSDSSVKHLILVSPFASTADYFNCFLPMYPWKSMALFKMPTMEYLLDVIAPVTIFSLNDNKKIKSTIKSTDQYLQIHSGNGKEIYETAAYQDSVSEILRAVTIPLK